MKKKIFTSTAEALAYIIKRIDGTEVVIGDVEEEEDEVTPAASAKKLWVRTYSVQNYESNFIMEVPSTAPNFSNFGEIVTYLDSIGKVATVSEDYQILNSELPAFAQYFIPIRGKFTESYQAITLLFTKSQSSGNSDDPLSGFRVEMIGLQTSTDDSPYQKLAIYEGYTLENLTYEQDQIVYADDFENSAE